jgi:hypothetical protein
MVPAWKKELDALVAETMAFAASVKERNPGPPEQADLAVSDPTPPRDDAEEEALQTTVEAVLTREPIAPDPLPVEGNVWSARLPPMTLPLSERDEIKQRLANFKAHQLRMQTERENFYGQTMARTRALAAGSPLPKHRR